MPAATTATTTYRPATIEAALTRPCGCGALAWYSAPPFGRIECAECGAAYSRPCGLPAPAGPAGADGGDDGGDGGPTPAASAARPGVLTLVAAHAGPIGYELSPEEEAELDEFERLVAESAPDPVPCRCCGRPASPRLETDAGPLCFACADGGAGGEELQRAVRLSRTVARLLAVRTALAVPVPAQVPVIAR